MMPTFEHATHRDLLTVQDRLRDRLRHASSLEAAAQSTVQELCAAFNGDVVLSRMFVTRPFGKLPEDLRRAAWGIVEAQGLQTQMSDVTPVLTLLGTYGTAPEWCDRRASRGHAAIPLSSHSFVDSIPMVARMIQEMGVDLGLRLDAERPYVQKILAAGWIGMFYVEDARTARDALGRRVIPAIDFVEQHGVRTVFGLGKAYGDGTIATFVIFSNKLVPRAKVEALVPLVNLFKASTADLTSTGCIFSATQVLA